jgi:purine-binding chemotaxis protein CheW
LYALPVQNVIETMRPLPTEALAGVPPFVRGLSLIRGRPVPVVDLGALVSASEPANPTRFVTLRLGDRRVALAVESVLGIRALPDALSGLPPLLADAAAEAVSAVGALDAELLLVLETARLVPDSFWLELDAEK